MQVNMTSRLFDMRPRAQEDMLSFYKRRARRSRQITHDWGRWSQRWRQQVISWNGHVVRAHDAKAWSHKIPGLAWRGLASRKESGSEPGWSDESNWYSFSTWQAGNKVV